MIVGIFRVVGLCTYTKKPDGIVYNIIFIGGRQVQLYSDLCNLVYTLSLHEFPCPSVFQSCRNTESDHYSCLILGHTSVILYTCVVNKPHCP